MREKLKELSQNKFLRNVSTLAFGTIISQAIVVLSSPLLTRIFTVEDFGVLQIFTSITVFFAVISTGRYELAIGLPKEDDDALRIIKLIIFIGFAISTLYFITIFILKFFFKYEDYTRFLVGNNAYVAPIYIFFIAIFSALSYWNQRKKKYKLITYSNAIQVISATFFSILFGFLGFHDGMIWSLVIGIIVACFYILIKENLVLVIWNQKNNLLALAKVYKSFPRYMIFSDLSLTASQQFIPLIFSVLYSNTIVGLYSLANRMLRLPNIVLTSSIANVFRNDAIDEIRNKGNCEELYISTFKKLIFMSLPIYILVFIFSPKIFVLIFGVKWEMAGYFARVLSTMLLFEFVATPLNTIFYVREKQKIFMRLQVLNAIIGGILIYLGYNLFNDALYSLILFSAGSIIFNLILLFKSYTIAKNV